MKYNIFGYLIGEGFRNVFKNKKSTFACLGIMCATMLIFGIFYMIGENIDHALEGLEESQGMEAFIKFEIEDEQTVQEIGNQIRSIEGVNQIEYVSKDDALNRMKARFKENQDLLDGYRIFKASYIVTLTDLSLRDQVKTQIEAIEGIDSVQIRNDTIEALMTVAGGIRVVTIIVLVLLILISIFIITNTIKLTVHARRKEISIMKYVGATNSFIRWPFIVEGIIIGVIAALISVLIIGLLYNILADKIAADPIMDRIQMTPLGFNELVNSIILVYLALGIGVGVVGSCISMRKYLEV